MWVALVRAEAERLAEYNPDELPDAAINTPEFDLFDSLECLGDLWQYSVPLTGQYDVDELFARQAAATFRAAVRAAIRDIQEAPELRPEDWREQ